MNDLRSSDGLPGNMKRDRKIREFSQRKKLAKFFIAAKS